jgi:hypothetical protein
MPPAASVMKPKSSIAGITGSKKRQMIPHKHPYLFVKSKNIEENKRRSEDEAKAQTIVKSIHRKYASQPADQDFHSWDFLHDNGSIRATWRKTHHMVRK